MENLKRTAGRGVRAPAFAAVVAAAVVVAGCGSKDSYKNNLRPPAPINVTAAISPKAVSVSPAKFGAGPIVVILANQSDTSQEVTIQDASGKVHQSVLVSPGGPGTIKVNVTEGSWVLKTGNQDIKPAAVTVGPPRPSAQNELLQP
jgi:hypothetical protein